MMNKTTIKDFLKPEWKKFIIPAVLIGLFFYLLSFFYYWGSIEDGLICELLPVALKNYEAGKINDTKALEETQKRIEALFEEKVWSKQWPDYYYSTGLPLTYLMVKINPFTPLPCSLQEHNTIVLQCVSYSNSETRDCMNTWIDRIYDKEDIDKEYRELNPPSIIQLLANILYLFSLGYLLSCLMTSAWNIIRRGK